MQANAHDLKVLAGILSDAQAASTVEGPAIDTLGYDEAVIVLNSGTNEATGTLDVTVEESIASGGTYAAITGAAFTQVTTANDNAVYVGRINLAKPGRKRYLHVQGIVATAACEYGVTVILLKASALPATSSFAFSV